MAENTKISWADHTFNPWIGCEHVSPGCTFCYAEELMDKRYKKVQWGKDTPRLRTSEKNWNDVRKLNKKAKEAGRKDTVFCASLADVGEDRRDLDQWRAELSALVYDCDSLIFLFLTKRIETLGQLFDHEILRKVGVGVTIENEGVSAVRTEHLVKLPALFRWISAEPLLGPLNLGLAGTCPKTWGPGYRLVYEFIHWVVVGGESDPRGRARLFDAAWAEDLIHECKDSGVAVHFKQLGSNAIHTGPHSTMLVSDFVKAKKGDDPAEWPEHLRVREFPQQILDHKPEGYARA